MLLWVAVGSGWWWADSAAIRHFVAPVVALQPATEAATASPLPPGHSLTQRVVMVILSGVGASSLNDPANPFAFETLRHLAAEGAWGISNSVVPSGDLPTWTALLTGAPPAISGVTSEQSNIPIGDSLLRKATSPLIIGSQ